MRFDPSGMNSAFDKMRATARKRGRDLAEDQGGFFVKMARTLGWKVAPSKEKLIDVAGSLGDRLRRKPGVTPRQELARRIRARGTFARGWHISHIENARARIRIWIMNRVTYSGIVDDRTKVASKAADVVGGKFKAKLDKLASQCTSAFK